MHLRLPTLFFVLALAAPVFAQKPGGAKLTLPRADSLLAAGQAEAAGQAWEQLGNQFSTEKKTGQAAGAWQTAGKIYTESAGKFDRALAVYIRALGLFREMNDTSNIARTEYFIAGCYQQQYDYPDALEHFLQAKSLYQTLRDPQNEASVLSDLSQFYRDCEDRPAAIETGTEALRIHEQLHDTAGIWYDLVNLGIYHDETVHYDRALEFYRRALSLSPESQPLVLNNIANTFKNQKLYDAALENATRALQLAEAEGDTDDLPAIHSTLCEINVRLGRLPVALDFGKKCLAEANAAGDLEMVKVAQFNLSEVYERMGNMGAALGFFKNFILARDSLTNDQKNREITRRSLQFEFEKKQQVAAVELARQKILRNGFIVGFVLMLAFAGLVFRSFRLERKTKRLIALEKQKSDDLLLNILPASAAEELKATGQAQARQFERATVLFSDFKDFTKISEQVPPAELVKLIDRYFSEFDRIVERHGIEKIKTIGDAYVCANGLNERDDQPHAMVRAALDIQNFIEGARAEAEPLGLPFFECRIGIHTGPVVAGVVGIKKFTYDIWGDTVNVAARMEQHGAPGEINLSEATFQLVRDEFACTFRGKVEAKNKGEINMYFVSRGGEVWMPAG